MAQDPPLPEQIAHLEDTTSFFHGEYNAQSVAVTVFAALAITSAFELLLLIFTTFRRYGGVYFWSLVVATVGLLPYTLSFVIMYFQITSQVAGEVLSTLGWPMMVTGQSAVLYSRLGVVLGPSYQTIRRIMKWIIIVDGVVLHTTTQVVMLGAWNAESNRTWAAAYKHIETIQMTIFTVQEFVLSGLYIWRAVDILKTSKSGRQPMRIMRELFTINVIIVIMDIALLVVQYQNRHVIEQSLKALVYAVKLKLEFAILNKLINIVQTRNNEVFLKPIDTTDTEDAGRSDSVLHDRRIDDRDIWATDFEKGDTQHIERMPSTLYEDTQQGSAPSAATAETVDQQRRRQTIETDDYAEFCRAVAR